MPTTKAEYMRLYRLNNPDFREKERERDRIKKNEKYQNDDDYRNKMKERALSYYNTHKKKVKNEDDD